MASYDRKGYKTVEHGPHTYKEMLHPTVTKNYGKWKYHEHDKKRPGVCKHVAESGDELYTVKAAMQRQVTVDTMRFFCDIADKYGEGAFRFTIRNNVEFMTSDAGKVDALIKDLEDNGHPIGGMANSVRGVQHTQGWLHCDIPAADASGVNKSIMDTLFDDFRKQELPNAVTLTTSCCEINCGSQADIGILVQHTRPPRINHDTIGACELPSIVGRCPVAAIRPTVVNGKPTIMVVEEKCICCGACFGVCPSVEINHPDYSQVAIWVGGKNSSTRSKPKNMKLVAHGLPNNPPRWPEVTTIVKKIIDAYKADGRPWERMGEWAERIGWKRFFEMTGLPFDKWLIDNYRHARKSFNIGSQIRH